MKRIPSLCHCFRAVLLLASIPAIGHADTEAFTEPVAILPIKVNGGTVASPTLSAIAPTLVHPVSWRGPVAAVSGTVLSVAEGNWVAGDFSGTNGSFYLEIIDGSNAGRWSTITACGEDNITTSDDLSGLLSIGTTISIRKHVTVDDFLGAANTAGLQGSTSLYSADEVLIYNGSKATTCWYLNKTSKAGWYTASGSAAGSLVIAPNQGIIVKRKTASTVGFVTAGTVKTGQTALLIQPGVNVVGSISAQNMSLSSSGLYTGDVSTGVKGSTSMASADQLVIYGDSGQSTYWYLAHPSNSSLSGWYNAKAQSSGSVSIAPGSAVVIQRLSSQSSFQWVVPAF
ncbi:MAG: hypothetical protein ACFUZC_05795 [Chthoniobacteraceae bacterium]